MAHTARHVAIADVEVVSSLRTFPFSARRPSPSHAPCSTTTPMQLAPLTLNNIDPVRHVGLATLLSAQVHYPFENKEAFEGSFPADFIAEGIDQTRGWFYTLMVLSTALFDKPPFKNLICNGLVLAEDGRKMSKRLKNYPAPELILNRYGADSLRLYLINSPVVHAQDLCFKEKGVEQVRQQVFSPWYHAYRLFCQCANAQQAATGKPFMRDAQAALRSTNTMDRWIIAACNSLVQFTRKEMEAYRLYTVIPRLLVLIEQLTNWYNRMNKARFDGSAGPDERATSLATLYEVLLVLCKLMAPLTPFFVEIQYRNLRLALPESEQHKSIHFDMIPQVKRPSARALLVPPSPFPAAPSLLPSLRADEDTHSTSSLSKP
jgi:isoleucyl-tRNA synthetase